MPIDVIAPILDGKNRPSFSVQFSEQSFGAASQEIADAFRETVGTKCYVYGPIRRQAQKKEPANEYVMLEVFDGIPELSVESCPGETGKLRVELTHCGSPRYLTALHRHLCQTLQGETGTSEPEALAQAV